MIRVDGVGDFTKTIRFLNKVPDIIQKMDFSYIGKEGVEALSKATPVDTGKTASSWKYSIAKSKNSVMISFDNTNIQNGVPIAIILRYGHGTKNGGYVKGIEYVEPCIRPLFDKLLKDAWGKIKKL